MVHTQLAEDDLDTAPTQSMVRQIQQEQLEAWVEGLTTQQYVFGIQAKGNRFAFGPLRRAKDLRLDYDVSMLSPKKYFQPLQETLMKFTKGTNSFEPVVEDEPFIILGVHPYDVVAISQMDLIFSTDRPDIHYLSRRQNATIIATDIQTASANIFASCMGTATVDHGFDILLTKVGEWYVVDARTEKGLALMGPLQDADEASEAVLARREQFWEDARKLFIRHQLKVKPQQLPDLLAHSYEHPLWNQRAKQCFSCGSCTMVCPTCYCFNVEDEVAWDLNNGERIRKWDSCQLHDFAEVAGGHNFRKHLEERFRHRFYRKGKYLWERAKQAPVRE